MTAVAQNLKISYQQMIGEISGLVSSYSGGLSVWMIVNEQLSASEG